MRRTRRNYITLLIGLALLVGVGMIVGWREPNIWMEMLANGLLMAGMIFIFSWMWGTRRWGWVTAVGLWTLLLAQRLGVLDWITLGAWLLMMGLITLVN